MPRFLKSQLLKVIEWIPDARNDLICFKYPMNDRVEIMNGSTLIVREGQVAIFSKDGKIADIFPPGRHRLETANLPVLTTLLNWHKGFKSPFKADVFYINTTQFTGQKWGTANPFTMRDPEFGVIRIRGFGTYNFKVADPKLLMLEILGSRQEFTVTNIREKLRSMITSNISDIIANSKYNALDLTTKLTAFNKLAQDALQPKFNNVGFQLTLFIVENISFPEEVERSIDSRSSVGILGDKMGSFVAMQQAKAMRDAATNQGGMGMMMGMGIGGGMAGGMTAMNQMTDNPNVGITKTQTVQSQQGAVVSGAAASSAQNARFCTKCGNGMAAGARFCPGCGTAAAAPANPVCKCGTKLKPGARFCVNCGSPA